MFTFYEKKTNLIGMMRLHKTITNLPALLNQNQPHLKYMNSSSSHFLLQPTQMIKVKLRTTKMKTCFMKTYQLTEG